MDEDYEIPARKMNWAIVAHAALQIPAGIAGGFLNAIEDMQSALHCHANHLHEKQEFAASVGATIDDLTRGENG